VIELLHSLPVQNELGEGVIWDHQRQRCWWTDIVQKKLFRYDPNTQNLEQWSTPERLCCFAPVAGEDYLVAAFDSGFAFYEPESDWIEWIEKVEADNPGTRLNDGRTDRQGRFWAGTMIEDQETATDKGSLYCLDSNLHLSKKFGGLFITNSLCWSPDSSFMYHCDTPRQKINQYAFDQFSTELGEREVLTQTEEACYPDGSIVDAQGYLWNAQWGGSKVVRYAPDGTKDLELKLPVSQPTCVAFGGANLDLLFVTSAHQDLHTDDRARQPQAGNLFVYQTDFQGVIESAFIRTAS